jgi:molecular chaperone GrpE
MPADDITIEAEDETLEGEGSSADKLFVKIKKLKEELAKANKEKQEYLEGWQRAKADYVNLKKRAEEERVALVRNASAAIIEDLLPALDSFDQALESAGEENALLQGIRNTHVQLIKALVKEGVTILDPLGETFDPTKHEPVETVAVESAGEDNTVTKVHQKGYVLNDVLIRPARVAVGHFKAAG